MFKHQEHVKLCEGYHDNHKKYITSVDQCQDWLRQCQERLEACSEPSTDKIAVQNKMARLQVNR